MGVSTMLVDEVHAFIAFNRNSIRGDIVAGIPGVFRTCLQFMKLLDLFVSIELWSSRLYLNLKTLYFRINFLYFFLFFNKPLLTNNDHLEETTCK